MLNWIEKIGCEKGNTSIWLSNSRVFCSTNPALDRAHQGFSAQISGFASQSLVRLIY